MSAFSIIEAVKSVAMQVAQGGDLTTITLPSAFCFPDTTLQMLAHKRMLGMELLEPLLEQQSHYVRLLGIIQWVFAGVVDDEFGKKPLNPVLGETYRCRDSVSGFLYVGEQVSHHPPISAYHFVHELHDMSFSGEGEVFAKFGGNYVAAGLSGRSILRLGRKKREEPRPFLEGATRLYRLPMPVADAVEEKESEEEKETKKKKKKRSSKHSKSADNKIADNKAEAKSSDEKTEDGAAQTDEVDTLPGDGDVAAGAAEKSAPKEKKGSRVKSKEKAREGYTQEGPWDRETVDEYVFDPALPTGYARGLIVGRQHNEIGGPMQIYCAQSGLIAKLQFKLAGLIFGDLNAVSGEIWHESNPDVKLMCFSGVWDKTVKITKLHKSVRSLTKEALKGSSILYDAKNTVPRAKGEVDDLYGGSSEEVANSVDVWKATSSAIREGNLKLADEEKRKVEDEQRRFMATLKSEAKTHETKFFEHDGREWVIKADSTAFSAELFIQDQ